MFVILMLLAHNLFSKKYNINYINMSADNKVHFRFKTPTEENDGIYNRHSNITQQKQQQQDALELLAQNLEKIRLLRTLENTRISEMTKLMNIEQYNKNNTNSTLVFWNFEGF